MTLEKQKPTSNGLGFVSDEEKGFKDDDDILDVIDQRPPSKKDPFAALSHYQYKAEALGGKSAQPAQKCVPLASSVDKRELSPP